MEQDHVQIIPRDCPPGLSTHKAGLGYEIQSLITVNSTPTIPTLSMLHPSKKSGGMVLSTGVCTALMKSLASTQTCSLGEENCPRSVTAA